MTSKNSLIALTVVFVLGIAMIGLRQQSARASVWELSNQWAESAHADRASESFVHWDAEDPPSVPVGCALCHSYYGFVDYLGADGSTPGKVDKEAKIGSVVECGTCHNPAAPSYRAVEFPSGARLTGLGYEALCMTCHHGRESTVSLDWRTTDKPDDAPIEKQGFVNPHYYPASATQAGADAGGGYQYAGQTYVGSFLHAEDMRTCISCHGAHSLKIDPQTCSPCHANVVAGTDLRDVRQSKVDYDGDGDMTEGIAAEIKALHAGLYEAIRAYAMDVLGKPIAYSADSYPYFFVDTNDDGQVQAEEAQNANRYVLWSPRLLRACYNHVFVGKDPGGFSHNPKYQLQLLYDSARDLGQVTVVQMDGWIRP